MYLLFTIFMLKLNHTVLKERSIFSEKAKKYNNIFKYYNHTTTI